MAYRRSLTTRGSIIARRYYPSFCYINVHHDDERKIQSLDNDLPKQKVDNFTQWGSSGSSFSKTAGFSIFGHVRRHADVSLSSSVGSSFCRYMSTATVIAEGSEKIELMSDVAEVLSESSIQAVASQVAAVNEVAIAAADSFLTVKALQYVIDGVHSFTGLNWWAAIALTSLLIRGATVPLMINQMKATAKLTLLRPHLETVKQQMQDKSMDPAAVADGQRQMQKLFKEYGVSPFTPLKGLFIQGPVFISFFLAVSNMAEKVPSFQNGGAYWFVDLTTPDSLYIFPVLTAVTFWITVECNMQQGMEGNPIAGVMKNVLRGLAVATVPFTMSFPKAIFCYWISTNLFSLAYGLVLRAPGVRNFLGVPEIPVPDPTDAPQPAFSFLSALKGTTPTPTPTKDTASTIQPSKLQDRRISSSPVISQRIRNLEREVKGRKKNKKR